MSRKEQIDELISTMQSAAGTAKARLIKLFDANSFVELGAFNDEAGVVTGYGLIHGKQVFAFSQEGPVGIRHARKIGNIFELAVKMGSPIIGVMDSQGVKIDEGIDALEAYGSIFRNQAMASGVVPQVSIVLGDCLGVASFMPVMSDFVIMPKEGAKMFMTSPAVIPGLDGKATTYDELGGGEALSEEGVVHCLCDDEDECFEKARKVVWLFPENNLDTMLSSECTDDFNRTESALDTIVPEDYETPIDVRFVIRSVADDGDFLETHKEYGENLVTGFAKFAGITVGIIANCGNFRVDCVKKAAELVTKCDTFNIPIVTLTDIAGYERSLEAERKGIMKYTARFMSYLTTATVPKINIILRNGIGNAYLVMNSKHIGADIVYAWPSARISLITKEAVDVLNLSEEEYLNRTNPYTVAGKGYVDTVIIPSNTRKRIISALSMLMSKREAQPARKHSGLEY